MAESQGYQTDTIVRPRRAGNQAAVNCRRLHRGLSLVQDEGDGAGAKTKQATGDASVKAGDKTPQVQMLQRVLEQLKSMGKQMK